MKSFYITQLEMGNHIENVCNAIFERDYGLIQENQYEYEFLSPSYHEYFTLRSMVSYDLEYFKLEKQNGFSSKTIDEKKQELINTKSIHDILWDSISKQQKDIYDELIDKYQLYPCEGHALKAIEHRRADMLIHILNEVDATPKMLSKAVESGAKDIQCYLVDIGVSTLNLDVSDKYTKELQWIQEYERASKLQDNLNHSLVEKSTVKGIKI